MMAPSMLAIEDAQLGARRARVVLVGNIFGPQKYDHVITAENVTGAQYSMAEVISK